MRTDRQIWYSMTPDQRFMLVRLIAVPEAEVWGGDFDVLRQLTVMGLVDEGATAYVVTQRGREIAEAGK